MQLNLETIYSEREALEWMLAGLESRADDIRGKMAAIRERIEHSTAKVGRQKGLRGHMIPEARAKISKAQRARWAKQKAPVGHKRIITLEKAKKVMAAGA